MVMKRINTIPNTINHACTTIKMQYQQRLPLLITLILTVTMLFQLCGCTTINTSRQSIALPHNSRIGIGLFNNNTDVPQAGYRARSIVAGLIAAKGLTRQMTYKSKSTCNQLIACPNNQPSMKDMMAWGRHYRLDWIMLGSVNEWEYKVGLDGEPAAAVTLELYQVNTGKLVWSAVGSKYGTSRSGLGNTAQELLQTMIQPLRII